MVIPQSLMDKKYQNVLHIVKCNYSFVKLQFQFYTLMHTDVYIHVHTYVRVCVRSKMLQLNHISYSG